ncbi:hypothetical protein DAT35_31610 [Vitiosangium sp. GDMCC 1.1324]|nr:hypothetical protein DAT35_31610 [Vitiosangium sp. GDMCC 1.1324]
MRGRGLFVCPGTLVQRAHLRRPGLQLPSVMHYGRDFFSKSGQDTMVPKQKGARFSDGSGFTKMDIQKLHKLYGC